MSIRCNQMINSLKVRFESVLYQKTNRKKPVNIHYIIALQKLKTKYNRMYSNYHLLFDIINNLLRERSRDMKILPEKSHFLWALALGNMIFYHGEYIFISLSHSCNKCITFMFATMPYPDPCCFINHSTISQVPSKK